MALVTGGVVLLLSVAFSTLLARIAIARVLRVLGIDKPPTTVRTNL